MKAYQAKNILIQLKKQIRQREVYEAIDIAIEALAWKSLERAETEILLIESGETK